jgi:hypothetical protein
MLRIRSYCIRPQLSSGVRWAKPRGRGSSSRSHPNSKSPFVGGEFRNPLARSRFGPRRAPRARAPANTDHASIVGYRAMGVRRSTRAGVCRPSRSVAECSSAWPLHRPPNEPLQLSGAPSIAVVRLDSILMGKLLSAWTADRPQLSSALGLHTASPIAWRRFTNSGALMETTHVRPTLGLVWTAP